MEGPTDTGACVLEDRPCRGKDHCALHLPWTSARAQLLRQLGTTSLADLVAGTA